MRLRADNSSNEEPNKPRESAPILPCIFHSASDSSPPLYLPCCCIAPTKPLLQKGDRFETTCYYDTALSSMNSDNVTFGYASDNEM